MAGEPWYREQMITEDDIRAIALALPGAFEQATYNGRPSWRTKPRLFAWLRDDPEALVVWVVSVEEKETRIAAEPEKFFTTPHYKGYPMVLVSLPAIDTAEAAELITASWALRAPRSLVKNAGGIKQQPAPGGHGRPS